MNPYKEQIIDKMNTFVHDVYRVTKNFPREELYGITSQLRRASLSVVLNYIEGYARRKPKTQLQFLEIAYGSLQETKYLLRFTHDEGFIPQESYEVHYSRADEIGAILWSEIEALDRSIE